MKKPWRSFKLFGYASFLFILIMISGCYPLPVSQLPEEGIISESGSQDALQDSITITDTPINEEGSKEGSQANKSSGSKEKDASQSLPETESESLAGTQGGEESRAGKNSDTAGSSDAAKETSSIGATQLNYRIVEKNISEKDEEAFCDIAAAYPYFIHNYDEEVFVKANIDIKSEYIDFCINDFKDMSDEGKEYIKEDMPGPLVLEINYRLELANQRMASILFHYYSYSGGAHPNTMTDSYNYDIENKKQIMLNDVFVWGYDYPDFLSDYCFEDIKQQYLERGANLADVKYWIEAGTDPEEPGRFEDFSLTNEAMVINFDPYEVGPYVAGPFTVIIPYEEFDGNILYP